MKNLFFFTVGLILISSCGKVDLDPGAEKIIIVRNGEPFLGCSTHDGPELSEEAQKIIDRCTNMNRSFSWKKPMTAIPCSDDLYERNINMAKNSVNKVPGATHGLIRQGGGDGVTPYNCNKRPKMKNLQEM